MSCSVFVLVCISMLLKSKFVHQLLLFGQVSSVEIERICNGVDSNILETAAIGVPPAGGGPEQLFIAVVFKNSNNPTPDLHQLRMSFNSALQKTLNPLFRVLMLCYPPKFLSFS